VTTSTSRARSLPRTGLRFAAVLLALGAIVATITTPARAATRKPKSPPTTAARAAVGPPTVTLDGAPAWVAPGADFKLHVVLGGNTSNLILRVSAHPAVTSRTGFSDTLAGQGDSDVVDDLSFAVPYLQRNRAGATIVPVGLQDPATKRDFSRLHVERTGVYPLTISLSPPNSDPVATTETWLVVAEQPLDTRLSFAWIWQLQNTPRTSDNAAAVEARLQTSGPLGRAATALKDAGTLPLSLVVGPETVETWASIAKHDTQAATGLSEVRAAVADEDRRQVLATPYVPLDFASLAATSPDAGADDVQNDLRLGADTVQSVLGVVPDPRTVFLDPVDGAALRIARDASASRIIVREQAVQPVQHVLTPARWFGISSGGHVYPAAASNQFVDQLLAGPGSRAERAQRFLAGLSLIALEAPSDPRGIVLATPSNWDPDPNLLARVLTGLRGNPFVQATTLDGYFAAVPPDTNADGSPIVTTLVPIKPKPPTVSAGQLDNARQALSSFRSLVGKHDPRVAAGEHAILIAPSSALDSQAAVHDLATIDHDAGAFLSSISTTGHTITLTSRTARIPLSFRNGTGQTVRIKVHLASSKLTFPDGSSSVLDLPPNNTTTRFLVEARTSGTFTMLVTLTTADDQFTISSTTMTVRSTVFSSIGVLLTGGALLFLAVWWGNHIWRSRRARRSANRAAAAAAAIA
jgi:Family of unknown function (DUF6049)